MTATTEQQTGLALAMPRFHDELWERHGPAIEAARAASITAAKATAAALAGLNLPAAGSPSPEPGGGEHHLEAGLT